MAHIQRRNGKPYVAWRDTNGRKRGKACPTKKAALKLKAAIEHELAFGRDFLSSAGARPDIQQAMSAFIDAMALSKAPSTVHHRAGHLDLFARFLGRVEGGLDLLTKDRLRRFAIWLKVGGRKESTVYKTVQTIHQLWAWLYDEEAFEQFTPRPRRIVLANPRTPRVHAPTWAEMDACIAACDGNESLRRRAVLLRYTGLRVEQVQALAWGDVDMDKATLAIRTGKSEQEKRGRVVPIAEGLVQELAGWGLREGHLGRDNPHRRTRSHRSPTGYAPSVEAGESARRGLQRPVTPRVPQRLRYPTERGRCTPRRSRVPRRAPARRSAGPLRRRLGASRPRGGRAHPGDRAGGSARSGGKLAPYAPPKPSG